MLRIFKSKPGVLRILALNIQDGDPKDAKISTERPPKSSRSMKRPRKIGWRRSVSLAGPGLR
jgi:hypothetical protein